MENGKAKAMFQEIKELPGGLEFICKFAKSEKLPDEEKAIYKFVKMIETYCPENIGLKDTYEVWGCEDADCYECWRQALKGFSGGDTANA